MAKRAHTELAAAGPSLPTAKLLAKDCNATPTVMPTMVGGNLNAPAIMIGERGVDLIRGVTTANTAAWVAG